MDGASLGGGAASRHTARSFRDAAYAALSVYDRDAAHPEKKAT
jgi:hypothetical protein